MQSISQGWQPATFILVLTCLDPCRVGSDFIILRISHDMLLESAVSQLHHRIRALTTSPDNPSLLPAAGIQTILHHLRSSAVTKKYCQRNGRPDRGMPPAYVIYLHQWETFVGLQNYLCPRNKTFSFTILIWKNFKEPSLRSTVIHIFKWLAGFLSMCNYACNKGS